MGVQSRSILVRDGGLEKSLIHGRGPAPSTPRRRSATGAGAHVCFAVGDIKIDLILGSLISGLERERDVAHAAIVRISHDLKAQFPAHL
jgi:hypothetical protein